MPDAPIRAYRFWPKVNKTDGCWTWLGAHNAKGYAIYGRGGAHRVAYRLAKGPIPDGTEIDHLCRKRGCVNPDHLEAVPHRVNVERAKRDECRNGHPYIEGSYHLRRNGTKVCKTCHRRAQRRHEGRQTGRRVGHAVVRHPDGGWGCRCGEWFALTQESARSVVRDHNPDHDEAWRP